MYDKIHYKEKEKRKKKHQFLGTQFSSWSVQLSHPYMTPRKTIALTTYATGACITQWSCKPCRAGATQDRWGIVKSYEKNVVHWRRKGKPLQYSFHRNPLNTIKRQKIQFSLKQFSSMFIYKFNK